MKKTYGKFVSVVLCVLIALFGLLSTACGKNKLQPIDENNKNYTVTEKGTPEKYESLYYDFLGGRDVMPIGGFFGPYIPHTPSVNGQILPDYITDDIYRKIADCGINAIVQYNSATDLVTKRNLALGEKYGVGLFAPSEYINDLMKDGLNGVGQVPQYDDYFDSARLASDMAEFAEYDSFLGLHLRDEPFVFHAGIAKRIMEEYNALGYENRSVFMNLLGYSKSSNIYTMYESVTKGDDYYHLYLDDVNVPMVSSTAYPFDNPTEARLQGHFETMCVQREMGIKYGRPWWRMMQAGSQWNDAGAWMKSAENPFPYEGETIWDINMALAFGAKGISFFPLIQPEWFARAEGGTYDFDRNGVIAADGSPTRWYYYIQKALKQVKAIDHILMNSASMGMIAHGETSQRLAAGTADVPNKGIIEDGKFRQLESVSGGDAIVGCFDFKGGTALYVVNMSTSEKQKTTLDFNGNYGYDITQRAKVVSVSGKSVTLTLEAGEGVMIVLR